MYKTMKFFPGRQFIDYRRQSIGSLKILDLNGQRPITWKAQCVRCGKKRVIAHLLLADPQTATCDDHFCGKTRPESKAEFLQAEANQQAREQADRDLAFRQRVAPIQKQIGRSLASLRQMEIDRLTKGIDESLEPDPDLYIVLPDEQGAALVKQISEEFVARNSWFYPCERNYDRLVSYFDRQPGVQRFTRKTLESVARRMNAVGLLEQRPASKQAPHRPVAAPVAPTAPSGPVEYSGFDPESGRPRFFTEREIDLMDAATFQRAFAIRRTLQSPGPPPPRGA